MIPRFVGVLVKTGDLYDADAEGLRAIGQRLGTPG